MNTYPTKDGFYEQFGGQFVPDSLKKVLDELSQEFDKVKNSKDFLDELDYYNKFYSGRTTPLYFAKRLTEHLGGAKIYLKREDLNHTGAHKINHCLGQALLAKRMGKTKIIAETGAGQHGVATATVCALFNMKCAIYMGAVDIERQKLNVYKMKLLGADVISVEKGTKTLSDAVDAAIETWAANPDDTYYMLGSAVGPHPYPEMIRTFQSVIGKETKAQIKEL